MLFKTKTIRDPNRTGPLKDGNLLGLTIGLTFYTPKYWSCKDRAWETEPHPSIPDWYTELQREHARAHSHCRWPYLHRSNKGYLYWTGPKRRYQLNYMGDVNPANSNPAWFFVVEHGRYTRWLDNGPQNEPRDPHEFDDFAAQLAELRKRHEAHGCLKMSHPFANCICPGEEIDAVLTDRA